MDLITNAIICVIAEATELTGKYQPYQICKRVIPHLLITTIS
jgi:hypothetical protein